VKLCSILIPVNNVERYVAEAIRSALEQTHPQTEVVVVNDGSTDATAQVITPFLDQIVYVEQHNRGPAAARNRALQEAAGDYIALLDGDDLYLPTRIERMIGYLDRHPEDGLATSDAWIMVEDRNTTDRYYQAGAFPREDQKLQIFRENFVMVMAVIRRELFERHGGFDERLRASEDWDLWIRFIWGGQRVGFVDEPLAYLRRRGGSLSADPMVRTRDDMVVIEKALARPEAFSIPSLAPYIGGKAREAASVRDRAASRRLWLRLARQPGQSWPRRVKALIAAVAPGMAARVAFRREQARLTGGSAD
jgi:glycosyltransferase involved in cell wall biosynthesis